jgi:hypothetical protein
VRHGVHRFSPFGLARPPDSPLQPTMFVKASSVPFGKDVHKLS